MIHYSSPINASQHKFISANSLKRKDTTFYGPALSRLGCKNRPLVWANRHVLTTIAFLILFILRLSVQAETPDQAEAESEATGSFFTLGDITIYAKQAGGLDATAVHSAVNILGADQLEHESVDSALELMRKIPGITIADFNQGVTHSDVAMRGYNSEGGIEAVRLSIDGIPANIHQGLMNMRQIFPLEIDRVEVVKGTNDPRYGFNYIAGNVNLFTRKSGRHNEIKLRYGSFDTLEIQGIAGLESDRLSQTYFGAYRQTNGFRDHSESEQYALSGKWFYVFEELPMTLGFIARGFELEAEAPGYLTEQQAKDEPESSPAHAAFDDGEQSDRHLSLHLDYEITDALYWSLKTYGQSFERSRFVRFTAGGSQTERFEDETQYGVISVLTYRPEDWAVSDFTLEWGIDYQFQDNLRQRNLTDNMGHATTLSREQDFDFFYYGSYVQADGRPLDWLRLTAGLRTDRLDGDGDFFREGRFDVHTDLEDYGTIWQPKFGGVVTPYNGYDIYGNWGKTFQIPIGQEAYLTGDDAAGFVENDVSDNEGWEVGVKANPIPWLTARIGFWEQTATDESQFFFVTFDSDVVGETRRRGWDFEIALQPHDMIYLWASYTQQKGEILDPNPDSGIQDGNEIDHVPEETASIGMDFTPTQNLRLSIATYYQDDYHLVPQNNTRKFGGYTLTNFDVLYTFAERFTAGFHVKNVFDEQWEYVWLLDPSDPSSTQHSPGDERSFFVSLGARF